jgi:hypothetical protein
MKQEFPIPKPGQSDLNFFSPSRIMNRFFLTCTVCLLSLTSESGAFSFSVKPYVGYARLEMTEVDENNRYGITTLSYLVSHNLPFPEPFGGNLMGGIQIDYHLENQYFLYVGSYYYREKSEVDYVDPVNNPNLQFSNKRDIELFEFSLGLQYYLRYSSWRRINGYLGGGAGFAFGGAHSVFLYHDGVNSVDNQGDFNSTALTAHFCVGIRFKFSPFFSILPEAGYRLANLQQMTGVLEVHQNIPSEPNGQINTRDDDYQTEANYDFSGFYFNVGLSFHFEI